MAQGEEEGEGEKSDEEGPSGSCQCASHCCLSHSPSHISMRRVRVTVSFKSTKERKRKKESLSYDFVSPVEANLPGVAGATHFHAIHLRRVMRDTVLCCAVTLCELWSTHAHI